MEITDALQFEILDESQVNETRRQIVAFAHKLGFDQKHEDRLAIVCTELATNLIKHTRNGGRLIAQGLNYEQKIGMQIYSLDSGRGMDIHQCQEDGYSSTGTYGTGLGAIKRMSDGLELCSIPGEGTILETVIWNEKPAIKSAFCYAGFSLPLKGQLMSGDKWCVAETENGLYCALIDGLGHGFEAAEASKLAIKRFRENLNLPPVAMIKVLHNSLRGTRGAVGAVARIDLNTQTLTYSGLGNIAGLLSNGSEKKHMTSLNGTLGYEGRKMMEFVFPWSARATLIMHSDGLSSRTFDAFAEVENESPAMVAGWLFERHSKTTDDATILVAKEVKKQ